MHERTSAAACLTRRMLCRSCAAPRGPRAPLTHHPPHPQPQSPASAHPSPCTAHSVRLCCCVPTEDAACRQLGMVDCQPLQAEDAACKLRSGAAALSGACARSQGLCDTSTAHPWLCGDLTRPCVSTKMVLKTCLRHAGTSAAREPGSPSRPIALGRLATTGGIDLLELEPPTSPFASLVVRCLPAHDSCNPGHACGI